MLFTRRSFVLSALAAPVVVRTVPTLRWSGAPTLEGLRLAKVGCGGMGEADLGAISSHKGVQIVALCDVDSDPLKKQGEKFPNARHFRDWREMYSSMGKDFDAVMISVADHMHAPIAMTGLNMGKHVYCQKPLAQQAYQNRQLAKVAASKPSLVTQMGTQRMAGRERKQGYQMLVDGVIGPVKELHAWTDRPGVPGRLWWPQGKPRPQGSDPIPANLEWDLFLGAAPARPYKNGYTPFNWRGTYDWGCGAFGDMACHIVDLPFYALELTYPTSVRCECTDATDDEFPSAQTVTMKYPATPRTAKSGCTLVWYDGSRQPNFKALGLPDDFVGVDKDGRPKKPHSDGGVVLVGEKGVMFFQIEGLTPSVFADGKRVPVAEPDLESSNHYHDWVNAVMNGGTTAARFQRAGGLCESLSLGAFSCMEPGKDLQYDHSKLAFTNSAKATEWCRRPARAGFAVENL